MQFALFIVAVGVLSLVVAKYIASQIKKADSGNEKMNEIGDAIHEGAMAFLTREYKAMAVFMVVMAIIIFLFLILMSISRKKRRNLMNPSRAGKTEQAQ